MKIQPSLGLLCIGLFAGFAMLPSCGKRNSTPIVEAPKTGGKGDDDLIPDAPSGDGVEVEAAAGFSCTAKACASVTPKLKLFGPLDLEVEGFVGEAREPVKWGVKVFSPEDPERVFLVYRAKTDVHPYQVVYVEGTPEQAAATPDQGVSLEAPAYPTGGNQSFFNLQDPATTSPGFETPVKRQYGEVGGAAAQAIDRSNLKLQWLSPARAEGKLTFTIRDVSQCIHRSPRASAAACNDANHDAYLFEQDLEVPFKVDKNILKEAQKKGNIWGKLAGCLVIGISKVAGASETTQKIVKGVFDGINQGEQDCSQNPFQQD